MWPGWPGNTTPAQPEWNPRAWSPLGPRSSLSSPLQGLALFVLTPRLSTSGPPHCPPWRSDPLLPHPAKDLTPPRTVPPPGHRQVKVGEGKVKPWGPSCFCGDSHIVREMTTLLWEHSSHSGDPHPAAGSFILPWGSSPISADPLLPMGTPALSWRHSPCHGNHLLAMRTLDRPQGLLPCNGDPHLAVVTLALPWGPLPCHGDPRPVVPLLTASQRSCSSTRACTCPQGHQPGGPDVRGHWEGTEPIWHWASIGRAGGIPT